MTLAANSNVKVNITTDFDSAGAKAAERELRRVANMQMAAQREMAAVDARTSAARKEALNGVANTMLGVGVAMTAMAGLAVAKFAEFDQAMSQVSASSTDAKANLGALKDAALEAGARTAYSATEAAGAIEELSKAGMGVADILNGGLNGALDLAAAGSLDVAQAAELTATTLVQFGLAGDQAAHVADLLSAGANKAQGSVSDMGLALSYVGTSAAQLGVSVDETAGTLALLASNGILAEKAGTGLRGVIMALTAPSKAASAAMEEYGINVWDTSGNFIGMAGVAEQLHANLGDLDEATRSAALGQIFGNEQINVARILYKDGAAAVDEWTAAVDDQGNASRTAAERMNNLKGDIEQLSGSWETFLIKMGEGANGPLRNMVQGITGVVNALGEMPPAAQTALMAIMGGGGLVLLAGGGMIKLMTAINNAKTAMVALGWSAKGVTAAMGGIGLVLGVATAAFAAYSQAQERAKRKAEDFIQTLDDQTGAITDQTREMAIANLRAADAFENLEKYGLAARDVGEAVSMSSEDFDAWSGALLKANEGTGSFTADLVSLINAIEKERQGISDSQEAWEASTEAVDGASEAQRGAVGATRGATDAYEDQTKAIEDLLDALDALNGANQSREQAEINWQKQLVETNNTLAEGAKTLDITTEAGRDNRQTMLDMAEAAMDLAEARLQQSGSEEEFRGTLEQARQALFAQARQFFATDEEAQAYVDTLLQVPPDVTTNVQAPGLQEATSRAENLQRILAELDGSTSTVTLFNRTINVSTGVAVSGPQGSQRVQADGSVLDFYGSGGLRESHVAQIAPAGSWRVWAEPETGGEAYIPLAPSKRARSLEIWQETGARLGVGGGGASGPLDLTAETIAGIGVAAARAVQRGVSDYDRGRRLA